MNLKISAAEILQYAKSAYEAGNQEQGDRFFSLLLGQLKRFCESNEPQYAVGCELLIYRILVKFRETEDSCERYFSLWRDDLYRLGLKYRDEGGFSDGNAVGFVMQTLYALGHTEALYNTLRIGGALPIYVLGNYNKQLRARFESVGCKVYSVLDELTQQATIVERLSWVRSKMKSHGVGTAVWVSTPSAASFAFGLGLAKRQVLWSHRHHAFIPGADLYLCYGDSGTKTYHGHEWTCVRPPMVDWGQKREKAPQFSFGTIAREEKLEYPEFLETVTEILSRLPGSTYDFCGKQLPPSVEAHFVKSRVWERCHFSGWVEPVSHVSKYKVFLETFPLGGICSLYACAGGVPVIVMKSNTNPLTHMGYPVSETPQNYVEDALRISEHDEARISMGYSIIEREKEREREDVRNIYRIL